VFVHGAMGDECAAVVKESALVDRYRVIDYHQRGWGNSAWPEGQLGGVAQAADCREAMRYLGVERRTSPVSRAAGGLVCKWPWTRQRVSSPSPSGAGAPFCAEQPRVRCDG
jgi:hypothetical protein